MRLRHRPGQTISSLRRPIFWVRRGNITSSLRGGTRNPERKRRRVKTPNAHVRHLGDTLGKEAVAHIKGEPGNPKHIIAPLPGMISEVAVKPGDEVKEGDKLVVIEAMKMLATVSAPEDGVVGEVLLVKGKAADTGDLLVTLK